MKLNEPLHIKIDFDGDVQGLILCPSKITLNQGGRPLRIDHIIKKGATGIEIYSGTIRIPIDLAPYCGKDISRCLELNIT
jgi:hypothetical protein